MGQSTSSKTYLRLSPCTKLANAVINMTSIHGGFSIFSKWCTKWYNVAHHLQLHFSALKNLTIKEHYLVLVYKYKYYK